MRIAVCDENLLVRTAFREHFDSVGHTVVFSGTFADLPAAGCLPTTDAVLLSGPVTDTGKETLRTIRATERELRVAVLTAGRGPVGDLTAAGLADVEVPWSTPLTTLERAIVGCRRRRPAAPTSARTTWSPDQMLSPREREVLGMLLDGSTTEHMAASLGVLPSTVHSHVQGLLRKLGARNRVEAVRKYLTATGPADLGLAS